MRLLLTLIFLSLTGSAWSIDCAKAITTPEANECGRIEQKKVEEKLNQIYQRILKDLEKPDTETEKFTEMKSTLVNAQRVWVKFREADCHAVYVRNQSGTIRGIAFISCMQQRAEDRIKQLEFYEHE